MKRHLADGARRPGRLAGLVALSGAPLDGGTLRACRLADPRVAVLPRGREYVVGTLDAWPPGQHVEGKDAAAALRKLARASTAAA